MTERKVVPFEDETHRLLRVLSSSKACRFGTTSPHGEFGKPGFARIGFADIPVVGLTVVAKPPEDIVALARQHLFWAITEADLDAGAVDMKVHIRRGRTRKFEDVNPSSPSHGKNKMGVACAMWLEITRRDLVKQFEEKLPRRYL